jgi:hypothetical protein
MTCIDRDSCAGVGCDHFSSKRLALVLTSLRLFVLVQNNYSLLMEIGLGMRKFLRVF